MIKFVNTKLRKIVLACKIKNIMHVFFLKVSREILETSIVTIVQCRFVTKLNAIMESSSRTYE